MSSVTSIGIWSLSLKIWFKSVAAETCYQKKRWILCCMPQCWDLQSLGSSTSVHWIGSIAEWLSFSAPLKDEVIICFANPVREKPQPVQFSTLSEAHMGVREPLDSLYKLRSFIELHVDRYLKHSQRWHHDSAIWAKFVHCYTTWGRVSGQA